MQDSKNSRYKSLASFFALRGVVLNTGAGEEAIEKLTKKFSLSIDSRLLNLYRVFNGFSGDDFDSESFIAIWSIEKILSNDNFQGLNEIGLMPFADFSFSSIEYAIPYSNVDESIVTVDPHKPLNVNLDSFCDRILTGRYDFEIGIK
jgi:hypothetical protein